MFLHQLIFRRGEEKLKKRTLPLFLTLTAVFYLVSGSSGQAQTPPAPTHPYVFFDSLGVEALHLKVQTNARLNKIWQRFKVERVDSSFALQVAPGPIEDVTLGRNYGDALGDLTMAYIVLQDSIYAERAIATMHDLAIKDDWGGELTGGHISIGFAFAWDVLYDLISDSLKTEFIDAVRRNGDSAVPNDVYSNINWTASTGEGLLGLAFRHDGDKDFKGFAEGLFQDAKFNYKDKERSVLWGHGTDGFPHQGLGYWRKYVHVGLFFEALRRAEPENDWFHLGKEFPGSEFLSKTGYPRIYADVQHPDLATLTWADSRQVRTKPGLGPFGNIGLLTLIASEYQDGTILDFVDTLLDERNVRFNEEDWVTFLWFDDTAVTPQSYRSLPFSRYWPDQEAAILRSGWDKEDIVFFMRSGSPGGHGRFLKTLSPGGHDHPDANGFVLMFDNDYLAAEDGAFPLEGPDINKKITYGHNTMLIDGKGQKGDLTKRPASTEANMDYLDAPHVAYLLGDATDAYNDIDRFYRYVIYKKHKYFVMVDELSDPAVAHKYEYLIGTDPRHSILASGNNDFLVTPQSGTAMLPVAFVEPRNLQYTLNRDRPYSIDISLVDLLRVAPAEDAPQATFFTLLYPQRLTESAPVYSKIYDDIQNLSGIRVDSTEVHLYNRLNTVYTFGDLQTDAKLCYFRDDLFNFEYLTADSKEFLFGGKIGIESSQPVVAAFTATDGVIRIGKNLGVNENTSVTIVYPAIQDVLVDGVTAVPLARTPDRITFELPAKTFQIGPSNAEQTVTDNYTVEIMAKAPLDLLSPNGGEVLAVDSTFVVRWESNGLFDKVRLLYSIDGGSTWTTIADSLENSGEYDWQVPDVRSNKVIVRVGNLFGPVPTDESDAAFTIDDIPGITSFAPGSGPIGSAVAIRGEHFAYADRVRFGDVAAEAFSIEADTLIMTTVPEAFSEGRVFVANQLGEASSADSFEVVSAPSVVSFAPDNGPVGSEVVVNGRNFLDVTEVAFGDTLAETFSAESDTVLRAIVPVGARTGVIKVKNAQGEGLSRSPFRVRRPPVITSFSPKQGPVGTSVEVLGKEFSEVEAVLLGSVAVEGIEAANDSILVMTIPATAVPGPITIKTSIGQTTTADSFLVTFRPVVTSFAPPSGPPGTQVSISGDHFMGATAVFFGDGAADFFSVQSDTFIVATVPVAATPGRIAVIGGGETGLSEQAFIVYQSVRTIILEPAQDTYVNLQNLGGNQGQRLVLKVEQGFRTYLQFNLSGIDDQINSAQLRLFNENDSDQGGSVYSVSNTLSGSSVNWTEDNLTGQNAPEISGVRIDSVATVLANTWVAFDVTPAVAGAGLHSFALRSFSTDLAEYSSKEGTVPPRLVVTTLRQPNLVPTILSFLPKQGKPGDEVLISGTRLNEVQTVRFDGHLASSFVADSFTELRVIVPSDVSSGLLTVQNFAGAANSMAPFEVLPNNQSEVLTFNPLADAYIKSFEPDRNFGEGSDLSVSSSKFFQTISFLKFDVVGILAPPKSAKLRLYVTDASSNGGRIFQVSNEFREGIDAWTESGINWQNSPEVSGLPLSSTNATETGWVYFDLTRGITANGIYSFAIQNRSADRVSFASRESTHVPELVVETIPTSSTESLTTGAETDAETSVILPTEVGITANYPNPFNIETTIEYAVPKDGRVRLVVYNLLGQTVRVIVDGLQEAGMKRAIWNGLDQAGKEVGSGVYFVQLNAQGRRVLRKITLQK